MDVLERGAGPRRGLERAGDPGGRARGHRALVSLRGLALSRRLLPLDLWTLSYVVVASVVMSARWPEGISTLVPLLAAHAALAACALVAPRAREGSAAGRFLGEFYALLGVLALYASIGVVNSAVGTSHDARVQRWEEALFGGQPARDWIRAWPWPSLSAVLHLGYLSYYLIVAAAPLGLWMTGRRVAARRTALVLMVAFYACYTVFLLFPVAGPRYTVPLADNAASAVGPARFTQRLLDGAAAWGTAFPSSHVAASLAASVSAWQGWPALGRVLVPLALLLILGTVYGQLHYAVDALAGVSVAALALGAHARPSLGAKMAGERPAP